MHRNDRDEWKNQNVNSTWKQTEKNGFEDLPSGKFIVSYIASIFGLMFLASLSAVFPVIQFIMALFMTCIMAGIVFVFPILMFFGYMQERRYDGKWVPCSLVTIMDLTSFVWKKKWHDENEIGPKN